MKAITLYQPYASWVVMGMKAIETRTHNRFACLSGQKIAIHAAKHRDLIYLASAIYEAKQCVASAIWARIPMEDYPLGAVVGTALVGACRRLEDRDREMAMCECRGKWGLELLSVEQFERPIPARGHQGIWEWNHVL